MAHIDILHQYKPETILNFDETALFWRGPNKRTYLLATEGLKVKGRKASKARDALLLSCDQWLIRSLKVKYGVRQENADKVSLYEVLMLVRAAWDLDVEQSVVLSAWRKSGKMFDPPQADNLPTTKG